MLVQLSVIRHPYQQSLILDENCITLKAIGKPLSEMFEFRGEWNTSKVNAKQKVHRYAVTFAVTFCCNFCCNFCCSEPFIRLS